MMRSFDRSSPRRIGGGLAPVTPLPPYSPELNPMENVWDYLRGDILSHKVWDTYDAIVQARAKARRFLIDEPERVRSIAHRDWASVNA
jgi:transposase